MWTCFVISIYISVALATELYNHNGWIPVSSDIVYNQIRRGITQAPRFVKADDGQNFNTDIHRFVSQHQDYEDIGNEQDSFESNIDEDNNRESKTYNYGTFDNGPRMRHKYYDVSQNKVKTDAVTRRSKKLADIDSNVLLLNQLLPKNIKTEYNIFLKTSDNQNNKEKLIKHDTHTYEVTENTINDEKREESTANEIGYEYNRPTPNFTTDFIKHLTKYDINEYDNLQNYALSRRLKAENPLKQDLQNKTLRFRGPIRYNSLNHLPVDPLLAVFLSNYGHYLQGQYGLTNNYSNLYGYLASNNIHNNKPFGLYKLFSDTDSSYK